MNQNCVGRDISGTFTVPVNIVFYGSIYRRACVPPLTCPNGSSLRSANLYNGFQRFRGCEQQLLGGDKCSISLGELDYSKCLAAMSN